MTTGDVRQHRGPGLYRTANGAPCTWSTCDTTLQRDARVHDDPRQRLDRRDRRRRERLGEPAGGPKLVGTPGGGMRLVFGGSDGVTADPFNTGQMYSATSGAAGTAWTLQPGALTQSEYAMDSYGTGATTLADGTRVAVSFPLNGILTWNAGGADSTATSAPAAHYDSTLARDGTRSGCPSRRTATPGLGRPVRETAAADRRPHDEGPRSSDGTDVLTPLRATAFVARPGATSGRRTASATRPATKVGLWRVGTAQPRSRPGSRGAATSRSRQHPAAACGSPGRPYHAVNVVSTGATGTSFGTVRTIKAAARRPASTASRSPGPTARRTW